MKKQFMTAGFVFFTAMTVAAQTKKEVLPPPPPAPRPAQLIKEIPPPPPPPALGQPPAAPLPPDAPLPPPEATEMQTDIEEFLKNNPSVKSVHWMKNDQIVLQLKNGNQEKYNLKDEKSVSGAEAKYGKLPFAPPPPPPLPPPPPKRSKNTLS